MFSVVFSVFYQYQSSRHSVATSGGASPIIVFKWLALLTFVLLASLTLNACSHSASDKDITHFDESPPDNIAETENNHSDRINSDRINIISPDWGNAATLTAMGHAPIATGDIRVWDRWVGRPSLPASTTDIGIRYQPNAELIAQLPVDMVIDNYFYEHARSLYGDVPAESVMFAAKGEIATWADYTEPTRALGALIENPKLAEDYIVQSQKEISRAGVKLQQRYPKIKKFAVVQFIDANNMRMYVDNSLFKVALDQMDEELMVLGKGNAWGFFPIRMKDLAQLDDETCLLIIDPMSPITKAEIEDSLIWQRLSYGDNRCMAQLPPVWIYGGMSSLVSLANNLSTAALKGGATL
ncbi:ABC transporter substrate-binding protein [Psychrobacter piscatorii]|uniref:ABC transporter substrate-binding protein n=1 Tax=Psychrobacter piscatorii TaxID=554343 RepID=UPI003735658E